MREFSLDIWLLRSRWSRPHRSDPDATEYLRRSLPIIRASAALIFLPRDSYCSPIPQVIRPEQQ
jgi:hypothetical protein